LKIALDAAAGDHGTRPNIEGAIQAVNSIGLSVILVGPARTIEAELSAHNVSISDRHFEIVDAPELIGNNEDPAAACRSKPHCSIMTCAELVASGRALGLVSTGHSGATMVAALWHLKRLPGLLRPAIAVPIPTLRGMSVLIDAGANTECKPWHLLQFAVMGLAYARHILKWENPKVGILSNGEEEAKGNSLVRETLSLLKSSGLIFQGPLEGRDLPAGTAEVIVCNGFVGNIALKVMEGTASAMFSILREELRHNLLRRLGALAMRRPFLNLKKRMSYDEYGGAPLLGVNGNAIICHGRSNAKAVASALRVAGEMSAARLNDQIKVSLSEFKARPDLTLV
jgi:glycerol-3-phosphate acyltransferase PlsX